MNVIGSIIFFLYQFFFFFHAAYGKCNDAVEYYVLFLVLVIAQEHTDGEGCGYLR